jgi:hypothetical protein
MEWVEHEERRSFTYEIGSVLSEPTDRGALVTAERTEPGSGDVSVGDSGS